MQRLHDLGGIKCYNVVIEYRWAPGGNERFIVDRRGEPAVVIMSVQDFIRTVAPPPDWLTKAWSGASRRGLEKITLEEIDAEIEAERRDRKPASDRD